MSPLSKFVQARLKNISRIKKIDQDDIFTIKPTRSIHKKIDKVCLHLSIFNCLKIHLTDIVKSLS